MRSIWSGVLSFGLINIPVKMYSATAGTDLKLNMLHKKDLSPIRYAKVCKADGKELAMADIVKGYEYQDGDYVILTDDDFKKVNRKKSETVDVLDFVKETEINFIYYEKPYYLEPDKGAAKAYGLLMDSLKKSKKVAVAKFVLHNKEHLGVIKPNENYLVLEQMRFEDEIAAPTTLNLPKHESPRAKELTMAMNLIETLTEKFDIGDYQDTYREDMDAMIKSKIKGAKPKKKSTDDKAPTPTKSADLMLLLKESLQKAKHNGPQVMQA
jgi:DNA end-binding protein Ku